jgi:hypothetical protein
MINRLAAAAVALLLVLDGHSLLGATDDRHAAAASTFNMRWDSASTGETELQI